MTAYLSNGGTLEHARQIAGHASPKTTKLYDRTSDTLTVDEIPRELLAHIPPLGWERVTAEYRCHASIIRHGETHKHSRIGPAPSPQTLRDCAFMAPGSGSAFCTYANGDLSIFRATISAFKTP